MRDRELDRAATGPLWLKDPRVAQLVAEALRKGTSDFHFYELLAWVVMPNHVRVVVERSAALTGLGPIPLK